MLKWIASSKGNQPHIDTSRQQIKVKETERSSQLTDNPLATINIECLSPDFEKMPHSKTTGTMQRREQDQIYSVTRTNPLFIDSRNVPELSEKEKHLMDDTHSSNRSEHCRTPSSSGYESGVNIEPDHRNRPVTSNHQVSNKTNQYVPNRRHHGHHQQHLVELSPASDYRRQFALGQLDRSSTKSVACSSSPGRIGKAHLIRQNSLYVTNIRLESSINERDLGGHQSDQWENFDGSLAYRKVVPQPVWPSNRIDQPSTWASAGHQTDVKPTTMVKQNKDYVTKILIAPITVENGIRTSITAEDPVVVDHQDSETYDSIVTHSLLMLTSYEAKSVDKCPPLDDVTSEINYEGDRQKLPAADIRQLSQTMSKSSVVASVSRALSKKGSSCTSTSEPISNDSCSNNIGGSISRRIALMKERWEKDSRRRLLTEREDDDWMATSNRKLDQLYVPQNGDVNFSAHQSQGSSYWNRGVEIGTPFSYLAGIQPMNAERIHPAAHTILGTDPLEQDRISNSSSGSGGSRRVTFSADTVDNEHGSKATISSVSGSVIESLSGSLAGSSPDRNKTFEHQTIVHELKLNPHYLPHRYQWHPQLANTYRGDRSRLAGYYSHNLQAHHPLSYNQKANRSAAESVWENYHDVDRRLSVMSTNGTLSAGAAIIRMEPKGDLQLHPNYGAACQDRTPCMDFTLDGGDVALLQRRSHSDKLRRRLCCCVLLLLCFSVMIVVVIGISLYLSHGEKIFGSLGL